MNAKKFVALLLLLVLTLSLCACGKKKKEAAEYYRSLDAKRPLTSVLEIPLGDYLFDSFLNRGMIKVKGTGERSDCYGALDSEGKVVLPVKYHSLEMEGDFFLAGGSLETSLYLVYNLKGEEICSSDQPIRLRDIGDGRLSASDNKYSYVFNDKGDDLLPGSSLDTTYSYVSCGEYILAISASRGDVLIYSARTSDILKSFADNNANINYSAAYLGGNDFAILRNETVTAADDYTVALKSGGSTRYLKQTVDRYTAGANTSWHMTTTGYIVSISDRYSVGVTAEEREEYPLVDGYYSVAKYLTQGKETNGTLTYCIADRSLAEVKALPEGLSPLLTMRGGAAACLSPSGAIYLLNEKLDVLAKIDDAPYQMMVFSGEIVTASKLVDGVRKFGGYDKNGRERISFEYTYIFEFVGEKAIALKGEKVYLVTKDNKATYLSDYEGYPFYWDGFYEVLSDGKVGLTSFDGISLLPAEYDGVLGARRYDNEVFVALSSGDKTKAYRLF